MAQLYHFNLWSDCSQLVWPLFVKIQFQPMRDQYLFPVTNHKPGFRYFSLSHLRSPGGCYQYRNCGELRSRDLTLTTFIAHRFEFHIGLITIHNRHIKVKDILCMIVWSFIFLLYFLTCSCKIMMYVSINQAFQKDECFWHSNLNSQ